MATAKMRRRTKPPKGYDSWFEYDLHRNHLLGCKFHPDTIQYVQVKMYEPDFVYVNPKGFKIYIETKGRFRDSAEARKYKDIRDGLGKDEELVFVFQNPKTPMPHAKKRRDGTKLTHGGWAEKEGFRYFDQYSLPTEWSKPK